MLLKWSKPLSKVPLCVPPETCHDDYMVNAAAISDDGSRVVAGTYYQPYASTTRPGVDGHYGVYLFDTAQPGTLLFSDLYDGDKGIYAVAISGDGAVFAGGGLLTKGKPSPFTPKRGLLRAFAAPGGQPLLATSDLPDRINSVALSRDGGVLAAVSESVLYVFFRQASGRFDAPVHLVNLAGYCETVAVHPTGSWLAAADQNGVVYLVPLTAGTVGTPVRFTATEPDLPSNPQSLKPVKFHSVAISRNADTIVAGGGSSVYVFTRASLTGAVPKAVGSFSAAAASGAHSVRWVAAADDGSFVTAVVNDPQGGRLLKLSLAGGTLNKDWEAPLDHPPNSTSIDGSGKLITVAAGYPNHVPGAFYLFDQTGTQLGKHVTPDMNWPMQVSVNGKGIVGGCDNNTLLFFTQKAKAAAHHP